MNRKIETTSIRIQFLKVVGEPKTSDECVDALLKLWNTRAVNASSLSSADSEWLFRQEREIQSRAQKSHRYTNEILGQ